MLRLRGCAKSSEINDLTHDALAVTGDAGERPTVLSAGVELMAKPPDTFNGDTVLL